MCGIIAVIVPNVDRGARIYRTYAKLNVSRTLYYWYLLRTLTQTNYTRHVCSSRRYISRMYLAFISQSLQARKKRVYLMNMRWLISGVTFINVKLYYASEVTRVNRGTKSAGLSRGYSTLFRFPSERLKRRKNGTNSSKRHLLLLIKRPREINLRTFKYRHV